MHAWCLHSFSLVAFLFMIIVHFQVPGPTDERQALPGFSWSFPRWPAELLPVSGLASLPGSRSLAGHADWGLGTSHSPRTKEATFGGHLSVLEPAVLLPSCGFTFVILKRSGEMQQNVETYRCILNIYYVKLCNSRISLLSHILLNQAVPVMKP